MITYLEGDLIEFAKQNYFHAIAHGCNCQSTMGAGIAVQMSKEFGADRMTMELSGPDINKLGCIDFKTVNLRTPDFNEFKLTIINAYTQNFYGLNHADGVRMPLDYEVLTLCMRKINNTFTGWSIGMPMIGAGLAGGDWNIIERIINKELSDMEVTVVKFKKVKNLYV
jgi:O-acetyl-ADP-ribose deacetylase (regulator of RNase III)